MIETTLSGTEGQNHWRLTIETDNDPAYNPRENQENLWTFLCRHPRYTLGDEQPKRGEGSPEEVLHNKGINPADCLIRSLFLLDHSGLALSTERFVGHDFDTSEIGIAYITRSRLTEEYPEASGAEREASALEVLKGEVQEYDAYLRGDVYRFEYATQPIVAGEDEPNERAWDTEDSMGGFLGTDHQASGLLDALPDHVSAAWKAMHAPARPRVKR